MNHSGWVIMTYTIICYFSLSSCKFFFLFFLTLTRIFEANVFFISRFLSLSLSLSLYLSLVAHGLCCFAVYAKVGIYICPKYSSTDKPFFLSLSFSLPSRKSHIKNTLFLSFSPVITISLSLFGILIFLLPLSIDISILAVVLYLQVMYLCRNASIFSFSFFLFLHFYDDLRACHGDSISLLETLGRTE